MMYTIGTEYYCRHDVHKVRCDGKKEKINKVNTMTTIETISWSKKKNAVFAIPSDLVEDGQLSRLATARAHHDLKDTAISG